MFGSSSNKPVCQFFLKGTCKYGTGCWNLHPQGQMGASGGNVFGGGSSGSSSLFGGNKPNAGQETKELGDFIKQISGEMNQWERSGQWLLSSFSPIKTSPPILGFVDTSPEELRFQAYEANKNNSFATYQGQWNELQNKHKQIREALKMSTPEAKEALKAVYNTKSSDGAQATQSNAFGGASGTTSTPSVFGGASGATGTTSTSAFGAAKPQSPQVFGGAAAFGATGSNSVFGQAPKQQSTFGAGASNSLFGASNSSLFNKTPGTPTVTPHSVFGSAVPTSQPSTFGNTQNTSAPNPFGGQSQGSLFGNATVNKANVFGGSAQAASVFGKPAQPTGSFVGNQTTNTLFGATAQPQSVFGGTGNAFGTPSSITATPTTPSLFGSSGSSAFGAATTQPATTSIFGGGNSGQQAPGSVFGASAAPASASLFGGAVTATQVSGATPGSVFGATVPGTAAAPTATASIFGAQVPGAAAPGSVFGGGAASMTPQSTAASVFGGGAANPGVFGSTPTGMFGGATAAANTTSVFGSSVATATQPQTTQAANPFGNAASVIPSSVDTNIGDATDMWYTPVDKLSAEDLREFQAESFTRVPLMPPPRVLCCIAG